MSALTGTGSLVGLILRRDRWRLAVWVVLLAGYPMLSVANASAGYDELARTSGFLMLYGPLYGTSVGAIATWSSGDVLWAYGLVSLLMVIRYTRTEEEGGRLELLAANVLGRYAAPAAALLVVFTANLALGCLVAAGVIGQGLPTAGAIALGLRFAAVGWVFAAVAVLAAQVAASASMARGLAVAALGITFLLRAAGDAGGTAGAGSWLVWLSPLGWAHRIRPFAGERWWVLGLFAAAVVTLVAVAVRVAARRDIGAGVLPPRPGPATAPPGLRSPLALAWRLQRGALLGWAAGFAVFGAVFGGAANSAADLFREDPQAQDFFTRIGGQAASDAFLATIMSAFGLIVGAYAIAATLHLRTEENSMRAEPVLATSVGRLRWALSHVVFSFAGPALALASAGLTAGLVYGLSVDDVGGQTPRVLAGALVQLPAVWVLAGITIALYGLTPRLASAGWAAWVAVVTIWLVGALGQLGRGLQDASPFTHIAALPGAAITPTPLIVLAGTALMLAATGLAGLRRRDIGAA